MVVFIENTKINSFLKNIEYGYTTKDKIFYFCIFPWDDCCLVLPTSANGINFYFQDQKLSGKVTQQNEIEILDKLNKKREKDADFVFENKTFLVYLPKNIILANLTDKKEWVGFNHLRPVRVTGTPKAYLAVYLEENQEPVFCRIKNTPSVISMINFRSEADNLLAPKDGIEEFASEVVFLLANTYHPGGGKKESHIRAHEHAMPINKKLDGLTTKRIFEIMDKEFSSEKSKKDEKQTELILPETVGTPNNKYSLSAITEKGFVPLVREGQVTMDVVLNSIKNITKACIESGVLIIYTNNVQNLQNKKVKDDLVEELGIENLVLRFTESN